MAIRFNADEVLGMAQRIEENAARFYRRAASLPAGSAQRQVFENLAAMEDRHRQVFAEMRESLNPREREPTAFDPYGELALYLEAMADMHGGEGSLAADRLTGGETLRGILELAIELEKRSILFYEGLKNMVPERLGRARVETVIREEQGHVATLMGELKKALAT